MSEGSLALQAEAQHLAERLFGHQTEKCASFTTRLLDVCHQAQDKDFLIIHNPGGWGDALFETCMAWERSIVEGVRDTVIGLGYSCVLVQHFRTGSSWWEHLLAAREQLSFFAHKAGILAAEIEFIAQHLSRLRVIMIGVSQGAGFSNRVMLQINGSHRVYSIEVGIPFFYRSRRVVTERTLAVDSNGLMPDALMEWDVGTIIKTYFAAIFRWVKYRLEGRAVRFSRCINLPGHDYNWEYPEVRQQIADFLKRNFDTKQTTDKGSEVSKHSLIRDDMRGVI